MKKKKKSLAKNLPESSKKSKKSLSIKEILKNQEKNKILA